jgi:hypothetical protein
MNNGCYITSNNIAYSRNVNNNLESKIYAT